MVATPNTTNAATPAFKDDFREGIQYFGEPLEGFDELGRIPVLSPDQSGVTDPRDRASVFQTLLAADALRYLTLQITGSKASGHPGGFASSAEAVAAFYMLGHKNMPTEVGHHAPGYYSAMFLDRSLEDMGIHTVAQMRDRYREKHGLLGHLSGYIPGILAPAGPLGQGQHFAMAGALLHRDKLFPVTIGDGGLGEPYPISSIAHFHTAYPEVTNFVPILVWNGYSQEHHSMVSTKTNAEMIAFWKGNGFDEVILVDAKDFDDQNQTGAYVDSTAFSLKQRLAFTEAVLVGADQSAKLAFGGKLTVFIIKQLKGAGVHARGAKSHNLYAHHTLDNPDVVGGLKSRALNPEAWQTVSTNLQWAGGGSSSKTAVTESAIPLTDLGTLPLEEYAIGGEAKIATTAMGRLVGYVGKTDKRFIVTNADGNEASGIANINQALKINHPTTDDLYNQAPGGQVYDTPATVCLFTAGALEQGRNGWTHQRPEIEGYFASMMRNGNVFPLFPPDANSIQVCYEWALKAVNKGVVITASKSPLPIRTTFEQNRQALVDGAIALQEIAGSKKVVFAVIGDMMLLPVYEAVQKLAEQGIGSKIVSIVSPRCLYRSADVAWDTCSEPDGKFLNDADFEALFGGDALIGVVGGASAMLEPVMLRSNSRRDVFSWKRGETTASAGQLFDFNGMNAQAISDRAKQLLA